MCAPPLPRERRSHQHRRPADPAVASPLVYPGWEQGERASGQSGSGDPVISHLERRQGVHFDWHNRCMRTLRIRVKPNARRVSLIEGDEGIWVASVAAPARHGKANKAVCRLVADHFGVPPSHVVIRSGVSARVKTIVVDDR